MKSRRKWRRRKLEKPWRPRRGSLAQTSNHISESGKVAYQRNENIGWLLYGGVSRYLLRQRGGARQNAAMLAAKARRLPAAG